MSHWNNRTPDHCNWSAYLDDGKEKTEVRLDQPNRGLLIGPGIWREMYDFTPGAVLMVLASEYYDENDYIRDYGVFLKSIGEKNNYGFFGACPLSQKLLSL